MKIGDQVAVIDEDLGGIITSVQGNIIVFEDKHGFSHQYSKEKMVLQNHSIYENIKMEHKIEPSKSVSKKHHNNTVFIDLHFDKLVANPSEYPSFERLLIQKEKLLETLDYCRAHNLKKLEIVHGIGDGILQKMVFDVLESQTGIDFYSKDILHHQSGTVMVFLH